MRGFIALSVLFACFAGEAFASYPIDVDRIEGGTIYFRAAGADRQLQNVPAHADVPAAAETTPAATTYKPLKTNLHEVKYLGMLQSKEDDSLYVLLTGMPCRDCQQERAVYMSRVDGGKNAHFVYPGRITDPKIGAVMESRAFFGRCLAGKGDVYVVFQKERVDRRRSAQQSVFVAEPGRELIHEKLIERRLPGIKQALYNVKRKLCHEVEGRNRPILKRALDLSPRRGDIDDDDKDEDDAPKESQTANELPSPQE